MLVNQEKLPGLADVHLRLSVQEGVLTTGTPANPEKCILCYPRLETGQAPACFHSCVGRIRYLGVLLYDADRIDDSRHAAGRMNSWMRSGK